MITAIIVLVVNIVGVWVVLCGFDNRTKDIEKTLKEMRDAINNV